MRIAIFTETYLPHVNGIVTHIKSLVSGLETLGHEVLIVTADSTARRHYISGNIMHCPGHTAKRFYGYDLASPVSSTRLKLIYKFKPDVIHVHNEFGIGISGMAIAKTLNIPLVYTLHTMYDEYIYYVAPKPLVGATTKFSHQYFGMFARSAQALTGPSKKVEEYFHKAGIYKPVNVIPNPVDLETFDPQKIDHEKAKELRKQYGFTDDQMVGMFVGRLGREKSVDLLLNYWKETIHPQNNVHLLIIGGGPCEEELRQQAHDLGIDDMVTFTGKVLHDEIPPYYIACDFYITASTSDTNSISMLEGMATGLPVLQIIDPLNEGQIRDNVNGFIFTDAQDMADKIRLLQDMPPQEREKLKESTRESVRHSGTVDLANYVLEVYRGAITKTKPRIPAHIKKSFYRIVPKKKA